MKIYAEIKQGSDEWRALRLGRPTASEFDRIITPAKGEFAAAHKGYAARLVGERFTGGFEDVQEILSKHMLRGIEGEVDARNAYEWYTNAHARNVGFCVTDDGRFGCSPDGLVYADASAPYEDPIGGLELKCPTVEKLIGWISEGVLPNEHKCQVHGSLAVTGLPWWDFMGFNRAMLTKPFVVRVVPDAFTEKMKTCMEQFDGVLKDMMAKLKALPAPKFS